MEAVESGSIALVGKGWYAFESAGQESFRWATDDAQINVAQLTDATYELILEIEPGPGVGKKTFDLAIEEDGVLLATQTVASRRTLRVELAAGEPRVRRLRFSAQNAAPASPVAGDPRTMKFRVFRLAVERKLTDIVSARSGLRAGKGWYALEQYKGETFRWAGAEAVIEATQLSKIDSITLEIEPGPGVGGGPLNLQIFAGDRPHGTLVVRKRETINMPWLSTEGAALRLRVEGGGKTVASDSRVMNFRAFASGG